MNGIRFHLSEQQVMAIKIELVLFFPLTQVLLWFINHLLFDTRLGFTQKGQPEVIHQVPISGLVNFPERASS